MEIDQKVLDISYTMFLGLLAENPDLPAARTAFLSVGLDPAIAEAVLKRYEDVCNEIYEARDPRIIRRANRDHPPWYNGPKPTDRLWPALRQRLCDEGFDDEALSSLDRSSTRVVSNLPAPWWQRFAGRGLVLGYVQSGKTSNFTATIAKAADAGYRVFIVLSGIHNNLRKQTQIRLDEQLVVPNEGQWFRLTDETHDFGRPGNADTYLSTRQKRTLIVIKKNKSRLTNLANWLESASVITKSGCPILVIDDEADQASVNSSSQEDPTVINSLVKRILDQPKIAYVGYTATPFANIFVDPTVEADLYPRDFIFDLPRPSTYFGPERLFGRDPISEDDDESDLDGLDVVRFVADADADMLRPPQNRAQREQWDPTMSKSLRTAIRYFLLATAARRCRGQDDKHSSMLIHTTQLASVHESYRQPVEAVINEVRREVARGRFDDLRTLWDREMERVSIDSLEPVSFEEITISLNSVLNDVRVVVDNYRSNERLDFGRRRLDEFGDETDEIVPQVVVVIGGNTLSRGLTLEGLVVSYFLRTASAYDTLLQMGRWFGFRRGYEDLPRIWMTRELSEHFQFLATVEAEVRQDVLRYDQEALTPMEFAVRVRTHPQLAITSRLKMQSAVDAQVSYSDRRLQTILFNHGDRSWLDQNWSAGDRLIDGIQQRGLPRSEKSGNTVFHEVPADLVTEFLGLYNFHEDSQDLVTERILEYVERQRKNGELDNWNVAIVQRTDEKWGTAAIGTQHPIEVGRVNRAAIDSGSKSHANIKSLMSKLDRVLDLDLPPADASGMSDAELQALRPLGTGLLLLYPINKDSTPTSDKRVELDASADVLGLGLVFPKALIDEPVSYKSVWLPDVEIEVDDEFDASALDTEASLDDVEIS